MIHVLKHMSYGVKLMKKEREIQQIQQDMDKKKQEVDKEVEQKKRIFSALKTHAGGQDMSLDNRADDLRMAYDKNNEAEDA